MRAEIDVIEMLTNQGASLTVENEQGCTPLDNFDNSWNLGELTEEDEERMRDLLTPK